MLLCLAAGFLVFFAYFVLLRKGHAWFWTDTYEYAQVARSIARGEGIKSRMSYVLEVWMLYKGTLPLPYFLHDLGNCLLMAAFFKAFGASDPVVAWTSGTFFVLMPSLTFLLGSRLFSARVGLFAAGLVLINTQLLIYSATGLSEVPYAFLLTAFFYVLHHERTRWGSTMSGVLYGALATLRSNSIPFLPWIMLFLLVDRRAEAPSGDVVSQQGWFRAAGRGGRRALGHLGLFLLGLGVAYGPTAARNYVWFGHPLYNSINRYVLIWSTSAIPEKAGSILSRPGVDVDPNMFVLQHPGELLRKAARQIARTIGLLLEGGITTDKHFGDAVLIFLFLLSVLAPPGDEEVREKRFRMLVYTSLLTAILAGAVTNLQWRHLYGFIPLVLIYVAELLLRLIDRSGRAKGPRGTMAPASLSSPAVLGVLALLAAFEMGAVIESTRFGQDAQVSREFRSYAAMVARQTPPNAIVLTRPGRLMYGLAWYCDGDRVFVEDADYTRRVLRSKSSRPVFLIVAPERMGATGSTAPEAAADDEQPPPGFVQVFRRRPGTFPAVLFRAEGS